MSATGRKRENGPRTKRQTSDFYATPHEAVEAILGVANVRPLEGTIVDAGAGTGAIAKAAQACWTSARRTRWVAIEKDPKFRGKLVLSRSYEYVLTGDFLTAPLAALNDVALVIGNPPYSLAREFVDRARDLSEHVLFLLRLNFLESQTRANWLRHHMPDVYVLSKRPSFTGNGTDATGYAWMYWYPMSSGRLMII